jgi:multicomponent Na+:H+ antiporter subunit A
VLFWRGHDLPGGGFIAGLVFGLAVVVARRAGWRSLLPSPRVLLAVGLGTTTSTALLGLVVAGAFGEPLKASLPLLGDPTTALLFDLGVVLVVLGLVSAAVDRLEAADDARVEPEPERVSA